MAENILVAVAWPYANGPFHVGHVAGAYLPADIFARYQRLKGNRVLMVSGSDCHGTPITLKAENEGITPQEVIRRYHPAFLKTFEVLGITFDLFTQTYTENHYRVTQEIFGRLQERGYVYKQTMVGSYSETLGRFLPDRFVEGICPHCSFARARGDQCDNCGKLLDPQELKEHRSSIDGAPVTFRDTEHFFLDLAKLEPELLAWLKGVDRGYWRPNTVAFTENWLREGLRGRSITRDLEWGVPVPVDDPAFKDKRIYVWFDAVIGYYSASIEWAQRQGQPELWQDGWVCHEDGSAPARSYYFIGKDNIPFHTIIWPAMLQGHGERVLPYDVPANEFLNLEGDKMSTSRNWALWLPDLEERYQPDQLRYYLTANAPEGRDSNWSWGEFVRRNNDELVATWGNLANRVLNIAHKNFGQVPDPGELQEVDRQVLAEAEAAFGRVSALLDAVKLKAALQEALAQRANQYISKLEPWKLVKSDKERAGAVIYTGLRRHRHAQDAALPVSAAHQPAPARAAGLRRRARAAAARRGGQRPRRPAAQGADRALPHRRLGHQRAAGRPAAGTAGAALPEARGEGRRGGARAPARAGGRVGAKHHHGGYPLAGDGVHGGFDISPTGGIYVFCRRRSWLVWQKSSCS